MRLLPPILLIACTGGIPANQSICAVGQSWEDADADGYGDPERPADCDDAVPWVSNHDDCDDTNAFVHPGADEHCDAVDEDCDEVVDDDAVDATEHFTDADDDGYGAESIGNACPSPGISALSGDCDDTDASIHPSADDAFDGTDSDCMGEPELPYVELVIEGDDLQDVYQRSVPATDAALRFLHVYGDGPVTVDVQSVQPVDLVLDSHSAMDWTVVEAVPGTVRYIWLHSAYGTPQLIAAPEGTFRQTLPNGSGGGSEWLQPEMRRLVDIMEEVTGSTTSSFHAIGSSATRLTVLPSDVVPDDGAYPECESFVSEAFAVVTPDASALPDACDEILAESEVCFVLAGDAASLVGLDSGETCALDFEYATDGAQRGLAWVGADIYGCTGPYDTIARIPLNGAPAELSYDWCEGVVADGDYLYDVETVYLYPWTSWRDVQCGDPLDAINQGFRNSTDVFTATGGTSYEAYSDRTDVYAHDFLLNDTTSFMDITSVPITAMSAVGDHLVIATNDNELELHDRSTGELLTTLPGPADLQGLVCISP